MQHRLYGNRNKSYFLIELTPCKELNRKLNLFLLNDRLLLDLKTEDDTRCSMVNFFLDNSMRGVLQRSGGLRIRKQLKEKHILVVSRTSLPHAHSEQQWKINLEMGIIFICLKTEIVQITLSSDLISFFSFYC